MSKSSGEFLTLQALLDKGYSALDYRMFCLGTHYRAPLNFSFEALDGAKAARLSLRGKTVAFVSHALAPETQVLAHPLWLKFWEQVADDLNSPRALAVVWDVIKDASLEPALRAGLLAKMDQWLALELLAPEAMEAPLEPELQKLLNERAAARAAKDFAGSDRLRDALAAKGILVKDTKDGQSWNRK
jgi:cysteinyl-tRNA synthetase